MDADEKRQRDLELLRKSRQALDEGELVDRHAAPVREERRQAPPKEGDADVVMYRGKAIRRKSSAGTPGAGRRAGRASQFRGVAVGSGSESRQNTDVRAILERLNGLYKDGLITKAEYDRKRGQILDRL